MPDVTDAPCGATGRPAHEIREPETMAKETSRERREKVAAMQAKQKAAERRRLLTLVAACVAIVALIGGAVAYAIISEQNEKNAALDAVSGDAAAASCDPVTTDPATDNGNHIGPGTDKPDQLRVEYATVPPSSGPHFAAPQVDQRRVYTVADAPPMETLVHNLEHGYTVLWYDPSLEKEQADTFAALAERVNALPEAGNKFLISPWNPDYGTFPEGKKYALSHWSADVNMETGEITNQRGNRQLCGGLSVGVVEDFVKAHPWSQSPEPGAM